MIKLLLFTVNLAFAEPNLILSQLTWSPAAPVTGDLVWVSVTVTNMGDQPTTNTWNVVDFFIKNSSLQSASYGPIGPCESQVITTPVPFVAEPGTWQMGAKMVPWMDEELPPSNVLSGTMVAQ